METQVFDGLSSDVEFFLQQFKMVATLQKWSEEDKKIVLAGYLAGPALCFYREIIKDTATFAEVETKLKSEFPSGINYVAAFYNTQQGYGEEILAYYYRLSKIAFKTNITESEFVQQFLKSITPKYKNLLATKLYSGKEDLKTTIKQVVQVYGLHGATKNVNLNVRLDYVGGKDSLKGVTASPQPTAPTASPGARGGETFYSPVNTHRQPPHHNSPWNRYNLRSRPQYRPAGDNNQQRNPNATGRQQ